jgi:uncharacterized protein (DUF1501 family)
MMAKLSRRDFLRRLGAVGTLGALSTLDALTFSGALAQAAGEDYRALVCVFLSGGNDGNNTVVPLLGDGYATYSTLRGAIAIPAQDLVPLASGTGAPAYGLHPHLAPLKDIWDTGAMALLFNVGALAEPTTKTAYAMNRAHLPDGLFSHADQQFLWQGTGPNSILRSGWGGRIADRLNGINGAAPMPMAISIAGDNLYVTGNATSGISIPSTGTFRLAGSGNTPDAAARRAALEQLLRVDRDMVSVKHTGNIIASTLTSSEIIDLALTSKVSATQELFAGQNSDIAKQLLLVSKLIELRASLGVKRQIFFVSLNGFDTHNNQTNRQVSLFGQLAPALKAFYNATVQLGISSSVTTFTLSDFGRTLQPNTGGGTDHGWGSHHFVIGGAVRGGRFYGQYPVLALGGPDDTGEKGIWIPATAVDQYAATLATWFGVSASDLPLVVPNIGRFAGANLGFMT